MRETNQIILWIRKIEQRMVLLTSHIIITKIKILSYYVGREWGWDAVSVGGEVK
jgi:hypothetical protein